MGKKKREKAARRLTPRGEFEGIISEFPPACRNGDRPCRNIVALGAGIILADNKGERGLISAPTFAINNALADLEIIADLAQYIPCKGPTPEWKCPVGEIMGQASQVASFGSDFTLEKGAYKRAHGGLEEKAPGGGTYL